MIEKKENSAFRKDKTTQLSFLFNSLYYFLDHAFILTEPSGFHLFVLSNRNVLANRSFPTLAEAKACFWHDYQHRACKTDLVPEWEDNYFVDNDWLHFQLKRAGSLPSGFGK
ncbi:MAG: hypothetical protein ACM3SY_19510 [Candidatus Omnitrophota bacterium]